MARSEASAAIATLQRLCGVCVDLLNVTGAGISVMTGEGSAGTVSASDELAARVEEWQFSYGEGPCRDAYDTNLPVLIADLADGSDGRSERWPVFGDAVRKSGIQAMFAFPLRVGTRTFGVLDLFRDEVGRLSSAQVNLASALADVAAGSLLQLSDMSTGLLVDSAVDRSEYRLVVHQAAGMVSVQLGVSTAEALVRLRARAFADGRTVSALATDVVNRLIRFSEDDQ